VEAHGIGLPGHFVARIDAGDERVLVDTFNGGTILTPADCVSLMERSAGYSVPLDGDVLRPVPSREFLLRMLNNLRTIHLDQQDYPRALAIVERIALLRPDDPRELRMRDALRRVTSQ
jgi:regulator of sirC expression with transglutaminase-like and TPR domain